MDRAELVKRLMVTFLAELEEHVGTLSRTLLILEREPDRADRVELVRTLFRAAHSLKGAAGSVGAGPIATICHRLEETLGRLRDGCEAPGPELLQGLFADLDRLEAAGRELRAVHERAPSSSDARHRAAIGTEASRPPAPEPAPSLPPQIPGARDEAASTARVASAKLDALLDRGGELMVACRRVADRADEVRRLQASIARTRHELDRAARRARRRRGPLHTEEDRLVPKAAERWREIEREAERIAAAVASDNKLLQQVAAPLEEEIRRVRMVPFASGCEGLHRAARDLGREAGKDVELVVEGSEVELDRAVLERLRDPLLHLVRNAVDHGLEVPSERARLGKPARGRITVGAALRGGRVEVEVADDGRGIDLAAVRAAARRRGLPEAASDRDLAQLVFAPGLTTAAAVSAVSGRGVGLDVVKSRLEALHGAVDLSFEPGRGARFSLVVPLTLTVTRVLLVRAGGQAFAFVGARVVSALRVGPERLCSIEGREALLGESAPMPVLALADALGARSDEPARGASAGGKLWLVVLSASDRVAAFSVDELVAEQEVIIKGLGARLRRVRHVSGATVLATGEIALVLNAAELVRTAHGAAPRRPLAAAFDAPAVARRRLLVVDDSVTTRTLVKTILEGEGYDVAVAVDGADALRILQSGGVDLVVSDVEMPHLDGFGLTSAIRASPRLRELPVVLVTALASDEDRARGAEAGASAYLPKSAFDQRSLLEIIRQLL